MREMGLSVAEAITAITQFYRQVTLQRGMLLRRRVPSAETRAALRQTHEGENPTEYNSRRAPDGWAAAGGAPASTAAVG